MPDPYNPFHLRNLYNADQGADNIGGLAAVWYTPIENFRSWPSVGPLVVTALDLVEGAVWYQLVSTRGSLSYDGAPKSISRQGDVMNHKIKGALPRHAAALAVGLEPMAGQRYVALYRDLNGEVQLIGTPDQPLEWSASYTAGSETKRNGYDWTLAGDTLRPARPYLGSWLVSEKGLELGLYVGPGGSVELRTAGGRVLEVVPAGKSIVLRSGFKLGYQIV
ncbi:hypothetical protein [Hymenobacter crusticola]|uniref:Uncharacterized protein n=1 Tax=Hymenobacter crusticola TaxID=1770526 RepID=A0A243W5K1_9BACT|nr:hypothetical protein [Hymenobacter crusticola]OUJ68612.1 hypothetical protein BXP70_27840 [Hymenobacter crusticola]